MKLYLVRHAQTNYNILKLANADPAVDVHLSDEGITQAKNLRDLLKNVNFNVSYISQLPRTRETAEIINLGHNKDLIVDARLNDNKTGFESKPVADFLNAVESLAEAAERARNFIDEIKTLDYTEILVVTHGFITQAIFGYLENKTLDEAKEFNLVQGTYIEFEI